MDKYIHLDLYDDAKDTLDNLKGRKLAVLSNGSSDMLIALVQNTGLDNILDAVISIDSVRTFKPSPQTFALVESKLDVKPHDVLFVSSNPFDACGAKASGMKVAWIERVTPAAMASELRSNELIRPLSMFKAMRMQMDELGSAPGNKIAALAELNNALDSVASS
jgi:2-haloacid dehalogenase